MFRRGQENERIQNHTNTVGKKNFLERKCMLSGSTVYLTAARLKSLEKEALEKYENFKLRTTFLQEFQSLATL